MITLFSITSLLFNCGGGDDKEEPANKLPVVSNISPSNSIVKDVEAVTLSADVSDEDGTISKVEFLINGSVVGEDVTAPYAFEWEPALSDHYELKVRATDNSGEVGQASSGFTAVGFSCSEASSCNAELKSFANVVMAFYPSWRTSQKPINQIPFEKLTHIIFSFATPETDGELNTQDVDGSIDELVTAAHAKGVRVYVSIGGAGGSDPFPAMAVNARNRALFVDRVSCYVKDHCLDGVDIDWEHWNGTDNVISSESNALVDLLKDLKAGLDEHIEISTDVFATNWFGKHYLDEVVDHVTYVNTMLYDLTGPWSAEGPQSAYDQVITDGTGNTSINSWGLMYWNGYRGWPKAKTVVGMPFYGRDFAVNNGEGVDYSAIVTRVTNAEADINADKIGRCYYDGPATAAKKAAYARDNGYAGVMFWELTGDTDVADKSLLNAIDSELN
jgi:chitinase